MATHTPQGAKVLLVDDDASLLKLLALRIESKGYDVTQPAKAAYWHYKFLKTKCLMQL
ncbi:hypothetical protein P4S68_11965 [Pseudoalteromonas sp. Hal099]